MPDIPEKLFKYRSFDKDGFYKDILQNKLYFASPLQFNDPFDCNVVPTYEQGSRKDIYTMAYNYLQEENPHLSEKQIHKLANKEVWKNYNILKDPILFEERVRDVMDNLIGVFSLTEKNDNLLMWSHYSDSHRGFCIQFNAEMLSQVCLNYLRIKEVLLPEKVQYSSDYPIMNPYQVASPRANLAWITLKSNCWEYEQEWRIIYLDHSRTLLPFPDEIITAIYFGVQCSDEHIKEVIELTSNRKNKLEYYKGKMRRFEFGIDFEKIEV